MIRKAPLRRHLGSLLPFLFFLGLVSSGAWAQTPDDPAPKVVERILIVGELDQDDGSVTATATRTATPVEQIPQSIQSVTLETLEDQQLQTISDALTNVSGVAPGRTLETVLQAPLIRGFPVIYYFDGLSTYGLPGATADPATLVNVARIDVAKGPSSTLYGGGAGAPLSGLLNIVSQDPGPKTGGSVALRGGSFGTLGGELDLDLPLSDPFLFRLSGMYEGADSPIEVIDSRRFAIFPTFAWDLSEETRLTLRGAFNRLQQREYSGLPAELVLPGLAIDRETFAGAEDAPRTEVENRTLTATLTHRLANGTELSFAARRYENQTDEYSTFPLLQLAGTLYAFGSGYLPSEVEKTFFTASAAHRFDGKHSAHTLLLGVAYDRTDYRGGLGINLAWGLVDYASPATNAPYGGVPQPSDLQDDRLESLAVFAQDQIRLGDRLVLTGGLRWTRLEVRSLYTSGGFPFADNDDRYDELTPRLGATFALSDKISLFAGHARGFQGVVAAFGVAEPEPETSVSNEIGLKITQPIPGLTGTLALYDLKRRNVITADPSLPGFSIQTGEQRSRGFETDLSYLPGRGWSVLFNYTYADAEITEDNRLPVGDRLRRVPRHSGRLAAQYLFPGTALEGLRLGLGVTAVSSRELTLPNTVAAEGETLWDLQAAYQLERFTLALSVVNLLDEDGFEPYQYLGGAYLLPTAPRSAYLTVRVPF